MYLYNDFIDNINSIMANTYNFSDDYVYLKESIDYIKNSVDQFNDIFIEDDIKEKIKSFIKNINDIDIKKLPSIISQQTRNTRQIITDTKKIKNIIKNQKPSSQYNIPEKYKDLSKGDKEKVKKLYNIYKDIKDTDTENKDIKDTDTENKDIKDTDKEDTITIDNFLNYTSKIKDITRGVKYLISKKILTEMFNGYDNGDQKIDFIEFYNIIYDEKPKNGWWFKKKIENIKYDDITKSIYKFYNYTKKFNEQMKSISTCINSKPKKCFEKITTSYILSKKYLDKIPEVTRKKLKIDYYFFVTTKINTEKIKDDLKENLKIFDLKEIEDKYKKLTTSYTDQKRKLENEIQNNNTNSMDEIKNDIDSLAEIFNEYEKLVKSDDCKNYKDYMEKEGTSFEAIDLDKINITQNNFDKIYPKPEAGTGALSGTVYYANANKIFNVVKNFKTPYYIRYIHF